MIDPERHNTTVDDLAHRQEYALAAAKELRRNATPELGRQ